VHARLVAATVAVHRPLRPEPLSRADLTWLHADTPTNHFVVTSLALLDERLDFERMKSMLTSRIPMHPRLRQVVSASAVPALGERWVEAPHFDLDAHIRRVALPAPAGIDELAAYVSELAGRPLDLGRPLWESHIIDGPGAGGALVTRFHHSLGDGQAMVKMLLTLTDGTRGGWRRPYEPPRVRRRPSRRGALELPNLYGLARRAVDAGGTLARLTLLDPDRQTSLRGDLTFVKRVAWSDPLPLEAVKRVAKATGTTVNDVIVSCIAGALGAHLRAQGEETRGLRIRAMVPVNLRPPDDAEMRGNRFSLVYLELPIGITDPRERLMRVKLEMDRIKHSQEPAVGWLLVQGLGFLPAQLEQVASSFYAAKASVVLTNVIGPRERVFIAGSPIRQMTFWEPESGGLGVGLSIYSYAGQITVGAIADRSLVRDPRDITGGATADFAELAHEVARARA
jgi:diacylglycerol O-acyltransferase / wax synthase